MRRALVNWLLGQLPPDLPRPEVRLVRRLHMDGQVLLGAYTRYIELAVGEIRAHARMVGVPPRDLLLQVFFHEYHHFLGHYVEQRTPRQAALSTREREQYAESYARLMMERAGKAGHFVRRPDLRYLRPGQIRMRWRPSRL